MQKKIIAQLTVYLPAGKAVMGGSLSSKLAPYKINIAAFLKEYNERTKNNDEMTIPAQLSIFEDKTFSFITKTTPTSELLLKALKLEKGGKLGTKEQISEISYNEIKSIALLKLSNLNTLSLDKAIRCVLGTALNMGINVKKE